MPSKMTTDGYISYECTLSMYKWVFSDYFIEMPSKMTTDGYISYECTLSMYYHYLALN